MRSVDDSKPINGTPDAGVRDEVSAPAAVPQDTGQPTRRRLLTVITSRRLKGRVPHICMSGRWLEHAGFAPGSRIAVTATDRQLVITVAAPPGPLEVREIHEPKEWVHPRFRPRQRKGGESSGTTG
jgi:hypothetical protein